MQDLFEDVVFRLPEELNGMMLDVLQHHVPILKNTFTNSKDFKKTMLHLCQKPLDEQTGKKTVAKKINEGFYELEDMAGGKDELSPLINNSSVNKASENIETLQLMMFWSSYTLTRIQKIFDETAGFIEETVDETGEYLIQEETAGTSDSFIYAKTTKLVSFNETVLNEENYGEELSRFFQGEERCTQLQELEADLLVRSAHVKMIAATVLVILAVCLITASVMTSIMTAGALSHTLMAGVAVNKAALLAIAGITGAGTVASGYTSFLFFKQHSRRSERARKLRDEASTYRQQEIKEDDYVELDPGTENVANHSIQ